MNDSDKFVDNKILSIRRLVSLELALSFFFFLNLLPISRLKVLTMHTRGTMIEGCNEFP